MRRFLLAACGLAIGLAASSPARAQSTADYESHRRAGFPLEISKHARPSDDGRYVGYYVGGGAAWFRRSDPPFVDEGTWGWDFYGGHIRRRVILNWWHGRRYQGGV